MFSHVSVSLDKIKRVDFEGKRIYKTPTGEMYPSVTSVTSLHNKDSIIAWRKRVGEAEANRISTKAASRGTRMHSLCEDYLNNKPFKNPMPDAYGMFKSIQPILDKYITNVHAIEAPLYSHHLKVAGTVDCIANFDNRLSIIDFKTSNKQKSEEYIQNYFMQCSAYSVMFEERTGIPVPRLVVIIAVADDHPQIFVKKRDDYIGEFIKLRKEFDLQSIDL